MSKRVNNLGKYALVTGASKGLGYAYCEELLKMGFNIIGVARDTSPLKDLKEQFSDLDVQTWDYDLSVWENNQKLFDRAVKFDVELLINNAGYGVWGFFDKTNLDQEMNMLDLNIKSLHALTKYFLNYFKTKNVGRILNIASVAAFASGPVFSSYYASKAYVLSLSTAINTELKKQKSKVRVVTICPGPIKTDFWSRSSFQSDARKKTKIKDTKIGKFCKKSLIKGIKTKTRNKILIGQKNKILVWAMRHAPEKIVLNNIYKFQKNS